MTPTGDTKPKLLFYEPGASWYWVLTGPLAAVSVLLLEISSGAGVGLITPAIFLVMVSAFVALQVKAARIHTSVELTHDALRQGTETDRGWPKSSKSIRRQTAARRPGKSRQSGSRRGPWASSSAYRAAGWESG